MDTPVWHQGELGDDGKPDGMGAFIRSTSSVVLGFYHAETGIWNGIMLTFDGRLVLGKWNSSIPLDVDMYFDMETDKEMFSQVRRGCNVGRDKNQMITLKKN
jgi:hypothetical protein